MKKLIVEQIFFTPFDKIWPHIRVKSFRQAEDQVSAKIRADTSFQFDNTAPKVERQAREDIRTTITEKKVK